MSLFYLIAIIGGIGAVVFRIVLKRVTDSEAESMSIRLNCITLIEMMFAAKKSNDIQAYREYKSRLLEEIEKMKHSKLRKDRVAADRTLKCINSFDHIV